MFLKKEMQLALHFPVHPLLFCFYLINEKFIPFFSESFIPVVHFFQNTHNHNTYTIAPSGLNETRWLC